MYIIAGLYRHRRLISPKGEVTRPTASRLRESLFNICQGYIQDAHFLDLFAGSGAIGLEAISRGAKSAVFIDSNKEAIRCIQRNISELNVKNQCQVLHGHVLQMLKVIEKQQLVFDIIFADPPYHTLLPNEQMTYSEKIIQLVDQGHFLRPGGTLFIEEAFDFAPKVHSLDTLMLKNSRRIGSAVLQRYEKRQFD